MLRVEDPGSVPLVGGEDVKEELKGPVFVAVASLFVMGLSFGTVVFLVQGMDYLTCDKWIEVPLDEVRCEEDAEGEFTCTTVTEMHPYCVIRSGRASPIMDLEKVPGVKVIPKSGNED
jgi:hypothetical protein